MATLSRYLLPWAVTLSLTACSATAEPVAQPAPEPPRQTVVVPSLPLALDAEGDTVLAAAVAARLRRHAEWAVLSADPTIRIRLHRHADGPGYDVVIEEAGSMRDAVLRLDCPPASLAECAAPELAATVARLLGQ